MVMPYLATVIPAKAGIHFFVDTNFRDAVALCSERFASLRFKGGY
jgi:hypothetical protein